MKPSSFLSDIQVKRFLSGHSRLLLWAMLPAAFMQGLVWLAGKDFSLGTLLLQIIFISVILFAARVLEIIRLRRSPRKWLLSFMILIITALPYTLTRGTLAAWMMITIGYALLIQVEGLLGRGLSSLPRTAIKIMLAITAAALTIALLQIEERFSEEEFFAALQAFALLVFWLLLSIAYQQWDRSSNLHKSESPNPRRKLTVILAVICASTLIITIRKYQHSFYPPEAPGFPGISSETPFLCGDAPVTDTMYNSGQVYDRLLNLVEANPQKAVLEYGLLALGKDEIRWARLFHDTLLDEARQALFTQPENSVKHGQCQAARRVYFYSQVREKYPELFNPIENDEISDWFAAVNQRALKVGWVDWMYALAFNKWPGGPYENQECGAGLLAILEATNLGDSALSLQNRAYLTDNPRGWQQRFRNTDDTYSYQPEWLHHAWFQYLLAGKADPLKQRQSFEWFLLQAIPDGSPLRYNHISTFTPGLTALWAGSLFYNPPASLVDDGESNPDLAALALWLAGRSADYLEAHGEYLYAQPGIERIPQITSGSPDWGSCLIYGDSGLPNQVGPIAPDKIVFRDGWEEDSLYMLLNLRFTGWHRYKGTNSIIAIYQGEPLANEINSGEFIRWLPRGRSLLRDKRIPRENLNGLLVERTGLSAVMHELTGIGSPWAQDPPAYAHIERFETGAEMDVSNTVLEDWRGWRQERTIYFRHHGPVVIYDKINGPTIHQAGISWNLAGKLVESAAGPYRLSRRDNPVEWLLIQPDADLATSDLQLDWDETNGVTKIIYQPGEKGGFSLLTVLLTAEWASAEASVSETPQGMTLTISKNGKTAEFVLE